MATAGLTFDYTLPSGHVLTSITGYRTVDRKVGSDEDATQVFSLAARFFIDDFEHLTQELRIASPGDSAFRYVVGAFFFDQEAITDRGSRSDRVSAVRRRVSMPQSRTPLSIPATCRCS